MILSLRLLHFKMIMVMMIMMVTIIHNDNDNSELLIIIMYNIIINPSHLVRWQLLPEPHGHAPTLHTYLKRHSFFAGFPHGFPAWDANKILLVFRSDPMIVLQYKLGSWTAASFHQYESQSYSFFPNKHLEIVKNCANTLHSSSLVK